MASRRSKIKRTIAPALVLMGLVFLVSFQLPGPDTESSALESSARAHLEKELAINKPRARIAISVDHGRSVQMLQGQEAYKDSESRRPLTTALHAYLKDHNASASPRKHVAAGSKVLVYTPGVVGWGNRVQGLYTSLAMALLTNRTLLVDWTSPMPLTDLVTLNPALHQHLLVDANMARQIAGLPSINANAWEHVRGYNHFPEDVLKNGDLASAWEHSPVVHFSVGEDWLPQILQNTYLKNDLMRVFGSNPTRQWSERNLQLLAHELLSFLIVDLSPAAQSYLAKSSIYNTFYGEDDAAPESLPIIVGVQIRIGTNNTSFEPFVDLDKDVPKFWTCADTILQSKPNAKIFLATDSADVKQRALERFPAEKVLFFEGPIVHSGNEQVTDEHGKGRSLDGLLKVVVDWWLLGDSQYLFRSRQSTFGRSAAVRRPTASMILPTQFEEGCPLR